jgi:hypothetical protein
MFKQVFIELMRMLSWRVDVVNYFWKIFQYFFGVPEFTYSDWLIQMSRNLADAKKGFDIVQTITDFQRRADSSGFAEASNSIWKDQKNAKLCKLPSWKCIGLALRESLDRVP